MAVVWSSLIDADATFVDDDDAFLRRTIDVPMGKLFLRAEEAELFLIGCCCSCSVCTCDCDVRPAAVSSLNVSMMETVLRAGFTPRLVEAELTADDDEDDDP